MALSTTAINEVERQEILSKYRALLRACKPFLKKGDKKMLRTAFDMALAAHQHMRRKSGEPYIYHPIAVAQTVAEEIGLGTTSVICALLHDVVEDTDVTLEEIAAEFGTGVSRIIDGLTKISGLYNKSLSLQAENFRKMLLTLADDARVILIKIADRLHNMRTMESMPSEKQLKIAGETMYLYAPLAHRLGLYAIKSELEDLSMKYTEPTVYREIASKLQETKLKRTRFIRDFIEPIKQHLEGQGIKTDIKGRPKGIYSIWSKMKRQNVAFEEVYDLFAIRIIVDADLERERPECWNVYSIITDIYQPNPNRLRDWISTPKANGYESLHTTVMGPDGKWVEVQIRSNRMNEIAEKGFAAHWKYKDSQEGGGPSAEEIAQENALEDWLRKVREVLENPMPNALEFVDAFKTNLYAKEIFIFTPKGDLMKLPAGSTVLDFAYEIHSALGRKCIGAKVNHKLVAMNYEIQNGDQVEVLTSDKQHPTAEWLDIATSAKARSFIREFIKTERKQSHDQGKTMLEDMMAHAEVKFTEENLQKMVVYYGLDNVLELYHRVAKEQIRYIDVKDFFTRFQKATNPILAASLKEDSLEALIKSPTGRNDDLLVLDDKVKKLQYELATCCNPIPGDDIFGFMTMKDEMEIHRLGCSRAIDLMSRFGPRIVKAKWTNAYEVSFLVGVRIMGIDRVGLINDVTQIVSQDLKVNMRSITVNAENGIFEGSIMLFVHDTHHLETMMKRLRKVEGVSKVVRFDAE